jgi:DNA-binding transcriptional MerR regulator
VSGEFSIGTLAERTGLSPTVLRTWENRFGFPTGRRTPAGHRRFTEHDVRLVAEVQSSREAGVPLHLAIDAVVRREAHVAQDSVHATLVREFPHLRTHRWHKPTLVAASHAIEDETLARAERSSVLGSFQEGHRYARSRTRWEELARTSTWSVVLADFADDDLAADVDAAPARCQLPDDSPLRREWTVVTVGPTFAAVLSAWEVPGASELGGEVYEAVLSTRRAPALAAARVLAGAAQAAGADVPAPVQALLSEPAPGPEATAEDADRLWSRALAHLDVGGR